MSKRKRTDDDVFVLSPDRRMGNLKGCLIMTLTGMIRKASDDDLHALFAATMTRRGQDINQRHQQFRRGAGRNMKKTSQPLASGRGGIHAKGRIEASHRRMHDRGAGRPAGTPAGLRSCTPQETTGPTEAAETESSAPTGRRARAAFRWLSACVRLGRRLLGTPPQAGTVPGSTSGSPESRGPAGADGSRKEVSNR